MALGQVGKSQSVNADAQCKTTGDLFISLHHRCSKWLIRTNAILHHIANLINTTDSLSDDGQHCFPCVPSLRSPCVTPSAVVHCVFAQWLPHHRQTWLAARQTWCWEERLNEEQVSSHSLLPVTACVWCDGKTSSWDIIWIDSERCYQKATFSGRTFGITL